MSHPPVLAEESDPEQLAKSLRSETISAAAVRYIDRPVIGMIHSGRVR